MLFPRTVLALALLAAAPRAQSDAPALARALAEDVIAATGLPGLSVAVALDGVAAAPVPELEAPTGEADGKPIEGTLALALAGAHGTLTLADGRVLRLRQLRGDDWALFDEGGGLWLELAPSASAVRAAPK